jgi:hypothetical protein
VPTRKAADPGRPLADVRIDVLADGKPQALEVDPAAVLGGSGGESVEVRVAASTVATTIT